MSDPGVGHAHACGNPACAEALRVEREARVRAEAETALLRDLVHAVTRAADLEEAMTVAIERILATTGWEIGEAWVPAADGSCLVASGAWRARGPGFEAFHAASREFRFVRGVGLPGRVWQGRAAAWIPDVMADANFPRRELAREAGLRAAYGVPVLAGEDVVAVLDFLGRAARPEDAPLLDLVAAVAAHLGVVVQRKRTEDTLRQSEAQLRHAQRLDSLGRLAGGVAHDFNNVLGVVLGYSDLVLRRLPDGDPLRADVLEIQRSGKRAAALTRQLLAFARRQPLEPRVIDLNAVLADLLGMLRQLIGEDVEIALIRAPDVARVRVDPGQIEQVLVNLAVNARDAMPGGGKLTIELDEVQLDAAYAAAHAEVAPGRYVRIAVTDTGTGMDAATRARLFEPFFTTKGPGKGTGLGLATAHGIVRQSGGHIWVYSEPGHGTTFKVYLPWAEGQTETFRRAAAAGALPRGHETVLVVEDDSAIRQLSVRVLTELGYRVLEATRGEDALAQARAHAGPIHLLLTDVVMPGFSGRALADAFVRERPETRVLFVSGYTANAIVHHGELDPGVAFLAKPFSPDGLARRVREVLDAPRPG